MPDGRDLPCLEDGEVTRRRRDGPKDGCRGGVQGGPHVRSNTPRRPGASNGRRLGLAVGVLTLALALLVGATIVRQTGMLSAAPAAPTPGSPERRWLHRHPVHPDPQLQSVGGYTGIPYTPTRQLQSVGGYTGIPYTPTRSSGVGGYPAPVHPDPAAPERRWLHRHPVHPDACRGPGAAPRPPRWIGCLGWRGRLEPPAHGAVTALTHPAAPGTSTRQPRGAVARRDGAFRCVPARACHVAAHHRTRIEADPSSTERHRVRRPPWPRSCCSTTPRG